MFCYKLVAGVTTLIEIYRTGGIILAIQQLEVNNLDETGYAIDNGHVRAFLFIGEDKALLIDSGFGDYDIDEWVRGLTDKPVMLVNTHTDGDHTGGNAKFESVFMHPAEYAHYFEGSPANKNVHPLLEGDKIDIGGRIFEVILIPGHTPGSISFLDAENRILVSGDSVSAVPVYMFGKARNIFAYIASMKRLDSMSDRFDTIYASHGQVFLEKGQIKKLISAAESLVKGEIEGVDAPNNMPAKTYLKDGVGFYY